MTASPILEVDRGNSPSRDLSTNTCAATAPSAAAGHSRKAAAGEWVIFRGRRHNVTFTPLVGLTVGARYQVERVSSGLGLDGDFHHGYALVGVEHPGSVERPGAPAYWSSANFDLTNAAAPAAHAAQVPGDETREENHD